MTDRTGPSMSIRQDRAISPRAELLAYETIWGVVDGSSSKKLADYFRKYPGPPSRMLDAWKAEARFANLSEIYEQVSSYLCNLDSPPFSVAVHGSFQYPERIREAAHPLEVFYYRGDISLCESRCVSVIGTRRATEYGKQNADTIARHLTKRGVTVVSGIAAGIDTAALTAAMAAGGSVIGVIGTPINVAYPRENADLQESIALRHLLISQVPFFRYSREGFAAHRIHFPERNITMAALAEATVIVEASETSGTLTQARACINLGRKLFILGSCFEVPGVEWPHKFEALGAVRVNSTSELLTHLDLLNDDANAPLEDN